MPSGRYSYDGDDYECDRRRATVQDVPYEEIQRIRRRELDSMQQLPSNQELARVRRTRTQDDQLYAADSQSDGRRSRYRGDDYRRPRRRRESAPGYDGDRGAGRRRSRRGRRDQNDDQQQQQQQYRQQRQLQNEAQEEEQQQEQDKRSSLFDTHGSDGFISAAAGAALGAITARHFASASQNHFAKPENERKRDKVARNWKMIGGAVVGAAAFNIAENQITNYFEEQAERKEDMQTGGEFMGEMMAAAGPDIL